MPLVITLAAAQAAQTSDGWVTIGYLGQFADPGRYGTFELTASMVERWQKNLAAGVVTGEPNMVAIDYEHAMDDPRASPSDKKASGWIRGIRLAGQKIQALIEWTAGAREAIQNGEFRYFSPTFGEHFKNDQGDDLGDTLVGGALTNRPFLRSKGALCVQLNQDERMEVVDPPDEVRDPPYWVLRDVSQEQRDKLAGEGKALPGGGFPIANESDLRNAIQAVGRAKDPGAAKALIRKRARELGREDLVPATWSQDQDGERWYGLFLSAMLDAQLGTPMMDNGGEKCPECGAGMGGKDTCPKCGRPRAAMESAGTPAQTESGATTGLSAEPQPGPLDHLTAEQLKALRRALLVPLDHEPEHVPGATRSQQISAFGMHYQP